MVWLKLFVSRLSSTQIVLDAAIVYNSTGVNGYNTPLMAWIAIGCLLVWLAAQYEYTERDTYVSLVQLEGSCGSSMDSNMLTISFKTDLRYKFQLTQW